MPTMKKEKSAALINDYTKRIDRKAGEIAFKPNEPTAFSAMNYQGLKIEVGLIEDKKADTDLLVSVALVRVPAGNRETFFQQLLLWNNFISGYGHFALGRDNNSVFLVCRRPMADLDFEEFEALITDMTANSFGTLQQIKQKFG
jgi:hypothetical protein